MSDVTDDGTLMLINRVAAPRRTLTLASTATGGPVVTYDVAQDVFAGDINLNGTLFSYARTTAPSAFDLHVATTPDQTEGRAPGDPLAQPSVTRSWADAHRAPYCSSHG